MKQKWLACASFASVVVLAVLGADNRTVAANRQPTALTLQPSFVSLPAFSEPVAMLQAPRDSARWFVVEKPGVVRVFANDPAVSTSIVFADITRKAFIFFIISNFVVYNWLIVTTLKFGAEII